MEIFAEKPANIPRAYSQYYSKMAQQFARLIEINHPKTILEAGCGKGQLTIPLLNRLPESTRLICVDSSSGPYSGWLEELDLRIRQTRQTRRVRLVKADIRKMRSIRSATIEALISNELLCDLPQERRLDAALKEFRRVLRPGGLMIHGEWASSSAKNSKSLTANHQPSWTPDQLYVSMRRAGFQDFRVTYFDTTIKFGYKAAIEELRSWGASIPMIERKSRLLRMDGLRLPFEHIVQCRK